MPAAFFRVPLGVALVAECDAVLDTVREIRSFVDGFDVVRDVCRDRPAVPLAVLAEILVPAHNRGRPVTVPLSVVGRIR